MKTVRGKNFNKYRHATKFFAKFLEKFIQKVFFSKVSVFQLANFLRF